MHHGPRSRAITRRRRSGAGKAKRLTTNVPTREAGARRYVNAYELALIHLGLGENDQAFKSLEQALREHSDMLV